MSILKFLQRKEDDYTAEKRAHLEGSILSGLELTETNILDHLENGISEFKYMLDRLGCDYARVDIKKLKTKNFSGHDISWHSMFNNEGDPEYGGAFCFTFVTFDDAFDIMLNEFLSYRQLSLRLIDDSFTDGFSGIGYDGDASFIIKRSSNP